MIDGLPKPDWQTDDGAVRLYLGDCLELLPKFPSGCVDAVVTDPPYCSGGYLEAQKNTKAQGLRGATVSAEGFEWFADNMGTSGLVWLIRSLMVQLVRALKPNRSALIFTDWRMIPSLVPAIESTGVRYRNMIVWDKGNAGLGNGFKPRHEIIMEFTKGTGTYLTLTGQNVINCRRVPARQKNHGAEKPIDLLTCLLGNVAPIGMFALDPFMGSGTTGVACVQTGRRFIGIEKEPKYFDIAVGRIENALCEQRERLPLEVAP